MNQKTNVSLLFYVVIKGNLLLLFDVFHYNYSHVHTDLVKFRQHMKDLVKRKLHPTLVPH